MSAPANDATSEPATDNDPGVPSPTLPSEAPTEQHPEATVVGTYDLDLVPEASGIATSLRDPGVVYLLSDGPGTQGVLAIDPERGTSTFVRVAGLDGIDTEGLAVAPCGETSDEPCLYVGDIGNNTRQRDEIQVWRAPEPSLERDEGGEVTVEADVASYRYPDQPVDAEALLIDDGSPAIISKEIMDEETGVTPEPRLLAATAFGDGTLEDLGPVPLPEPQSGFAAAVVGNVVTGGDHNAERVVLRTYDHVVEYRPPSADANLDTLADWPAHERPAPRMMQGEAVSLADDGCGLWLVSETVQSVWHVPCDG